MGDKPAKVLVKIIRDEVFTPYWLKLTGQAAAFERHSQNTRDESAAIKRKRVLTSNVRETQAELKPYSDLTFQISIKDVLKPSPRRYL